MSNKRYPRGKPEFTEAERKEIEGMSMDNEQINDGEVFKTMFLDGLKKIGLWNGELPKKLMIDGKEMGLDLTKMDLYGPGPWIDEPDIVEIKYRGIQCAIRRTNPMGHLCGYIAVPDNHPWAGKDEEEIECDVHGGLTYCEREECGYIIGFDCAHAQDIVPRMDKLNRDYKEHGIVSPLSPKPAWDSTYKNIAFVRKEIEKLVDQMLEAADGKV